MPVLILCIALTACAGGGHGGRGKPDDGGTWGAASTDALYASFTPAPGTESFTALAARQTADAPVGLDEPSGLISLASSLCAGVLALRLRRRRLKSRPKR